MSDTTKLLSADDQEYALLLQRVGDTMERGRQQIVSAVNTAIVLSYWEIGRYIVEYEQEGNNRATYGSDILNRLSRDLTELYGKGFSRGNIFYMRKLYLTYPKVQTVSELLSWSHYIELLKLDDPLERSFYEKEAEAERWGVRELKRQMKSMLFHRLALSSDKAEVLRLAGEGQIIEKPEDILKDPYVFEFTGLPQLPVYKEGDLEAALVDNLSQFFLELGKGFTYVGRQQKVNIGGRTFKVDLVFYHRILKCFVLIDLKLGEVQHEDIGQIYQQPGVRQQISALFAGKSAVGSGVSSLYGYCGIKQRSLIGYKGIHTANPENPFLLSTGVDR